MRRSARLIEMQAKDGANKVQREPRAKKKRSNVRTTHIATLDNGTMVETFKFLNYCQLAKKSLVSKRFWDLIRTHRNSLALRYVDSLVMSDFNTSPSLIRIFGQKLSPEGYKKWANSSGYSECSPIKNQVVRHQVYVLWAFADYTGSAHVFYAQTRLNHRHWPLFQHFVRLLLDPCIYIRHIDFIPENNFFNYLAGEFNQDRNRLQCKKFTLNFEATFIEANFHKYIDWIKNRVSCNEIRIQHFIHLRYVEELLDLFMTGAQCTSAICIDHCLRSRLVIKFVQKFKDLKSSDEYQIIESIRDSPTRRGIDYELLNMKQDYADFMVKEQRDEEEDDTIERVFEFINDDVGKKLQITEKSSGTGYETYLSYVMTVKNL
ncbi:hypothetical protein Ddc_19082 [Ditylenchus destructor]|nr:hypothetical protein Ddc_19082 [Ditylenchus destructor]